jgi:tRNA(fMet)-specific endonuclease VapC
MRLLDTDACIRIIRKQPEFVEKFRKLSSDSVFISVVSLHELHYGSLHSANPERKLAALRDFTKFLKILPFTRSSAKKSAEIREALSAKGTPIGPLDTLIAGHAIEHGLTLVTGNLREFSRVDGLPLENWDNP